MKYVYFITFRANGVFSNTVCSLNYQIDSLESVRASEIKISLDCGGQNVIITNFQLLRTEPDETDGVKIPDPTGWENVPEWAMYKTMDKDGEVWIWANEPTQKIDEWNEDSGIWGFVGNIKNPGDYDWTKMIEARPAK